MKQSFLILVCSFFSFVMYAQQLSVDGFIKQTAQASYMVNVSADLPDGFILRVSNPQQKKLRVRIQHFINGVIIDTIIRSDSYACRYNFSNAEEGRYIVRVRNGREKYKRVVDVSSVERVEKRVELR